MGNAGVSHGSSHRSILFLIYINEHADDFLKNNAISTYDFTLDVDCDWAYDLILLSILETDL